MIGKPGLSCGARKPSSCFSYPHRDGWWSPTDCQRIQRNSQSIEESSQTWIAEYSKPLEFAFNRCCSASHYYTPSCSHTCCNNWPKRSCETPRKIHPLSCSCYREGECWKNNAAKAGVQYHWGAIHLRRGEKPSELSAYRDIPFSSFLHQQLEPTSKVPARWFLHLS